MESKKAQDLEETKKETNIVETIKQSRKIIFIATAVVAVIVAACIFWGISRSNKAKKADEFAGIADIAMNDSIATANYMQAAELGTPSGERAKLQLAINLYRQGEYQQAIDYLKDADIDSDVVSAGQYALMGDCYVNLDNLDEALDCYKKAVKEADGNPQITPFILVKEANLYRAQQKYAEEAAAYQTIFEEYPAYANGLNFDIRKYAARANQQAGN